jgi:hypothetical protein
MSEETTASSSTLRQRKNSTASDSRGREGIGGPGGKNAKSEPGSQTSLTSRRSNVSSRNGSNSGAKSPKSPKPKLPYSGFDWKLQYQEDMANAAKNGGVMQKLSHTFFQDPKNQPKLKGNRYENLNWVQKLGRWCRDTRILYLTPLQLLVVLMGLAWVFMPKEYRMVFKKLFRVMGKLAKAR